MKRTWIEINNCEFDAGDIPDMSNIDLMVLSNECGDYRKELVDKEIKKRQKEAERSHLHVVK